jgi:hypothetical protein
MARRGEWPHAHSRNHQRTWAASRWLALNMGLLLAIPGPALAGFDEGMAAEDALNLYYSQRSTPSCGSLVPINIALGAIAKP